MLNKEKEGHTRLPSKALKKFPSIFNGKRDNDLAKVSHWWKNRDTILSAIETVNTTATRVSCETRKVTQNKALIGRGPKQQAWVQWLYPILKDEFERLRALGLKFNKALLGKLAQDIILRSENETFHRSTRNKKGKRIIEVVEKQHFIDQFCVKNRIVIRKQTGKLQLSNEKEVYIAKTVAYHLGQLKRDFDSGKLDENYVENMDETHFVFNMDDGKTLGFIGDNEVKYADVSSGGDPMTMVVRISGGANARLERTMMIFMNKERNYPIKTLPLHEIPDSMAYRTGPKGWMDRQNFVEWIKEIPPDPYGLKRVIFLDNCGGHNETPQLIEELRRKNIELRRLPENATDLCQPADSFVIQKIKEEWRAQWSQKKFELIQNDQWCNKVRKDGTWSGKLKNPGKKYFLRLADECIQAVNNKRDLNGLTYARKAMISCGLSRHVDGRWHEAQLFPHLQKIINDYREYFDGKQVEEP